VVSVSSAVWVAHKSTCRLWMSTSNEIGTVSRSAMRCGTLKVQILDRLSKRLDDLRVLPYISLHILVVAHPGGVQSTILRRDLSSIPSKTSQLYFRLLSTYSYHRDGQLHLTSENTKSTLPWLPQFLASSKPALSSTWWSGRCTSHMANPC